jgi:hypothetical protein
MRAAFLADAEPAAVSHAVRDVLERRGALVSEHIGSHIRFSTRPSRASWERAGYVGIFQHIGEKEVEVRLLLRAKWPSRILWAVAIVDLVIAIGTFLVSAFVATVAGTAWFVLAFLTGLALLVAGLVHLNTLRGVREEERLLMEDIEAEFARDHVGAAVERDEDRALREAEADLEGEVERVRVARARKGAKAEKPTKAARATTRVGGLKLSFRKRPPEPDAPAESPDEKRARLLARKAELEAETKDAGDGSSGPR